MRFTVPFLLAIAVYVATVLGANQTSFNPNEDMLYDVVSASDAIAFRLERAIGLPEQLALLTGALLLTIPALLTFHLFRVGFGGSISSLLQEERLSRQMAREREHVAAARYATADTPATAAGEDKERRTGRDRRNGEDRRRGVGANIAAALKSRTARKEGTDSSTSAGTTSGTTSLSGQTDGASASSGRGLKDRWSGLLENKPDLSRLKSGAQNLRERMGTRSASSGKTSAGSSGSPGTTGSSGKLSIDDIADD